MHFSGNETERRNRRDRKEKKATGNGKNMRKMHLFDTYKEAGRFQGGFPGIHGS